MSTHIEFAHTCSNNFHPFNFKSTFVNIFTPPTHIKVFYVRGGLIYLKSNTKKWIFSATIHPTRKNLIFPESLLKTDHFEKKVNRDGVPLNFYGGKAVIFVLNRYNA